MVSSLMENPTDTDRLLLKPLQRLPLCRLSPTLVTYHPVASIPHNEVIPERRSVSDWEKTTIYHKINGQVVVVVYCNTRRGIYWLTCNFYYLAVKTNHHFRM